MTSTRPYLVRAFYDWILDNLLTPYILVDANKPRVDVPEQYISEGKIIFNITPGIVEKLEITNDEVYFDARFSGVLRHVYFPMNAVNAIYAKENGRGMVFNEEDDSDDGGEHPPTPTAPSGDEGSQGSKPKKGKPKLTVVK